MQKYKKRIQRFAACTDVYFKKSGEIIRNPKTIDILNDNGQNHYRSTSTPCSCYLCSFNKYDRAKSKNERRKLPEY